MKFPKYKPIKINAKFPIYKEPRIKKPTYKKPTFRSVNIRPPRIRIRLDSDRDGVVDRKDCQPYNPYEQDRRLNKQQEEEVRKLPIYFTAQPGLWQTGNLYHYTSKKMSKGAYKGKKRFQASIKRRPEVIGEIKRKKPRAVIVKTQGIETGEQEMVIGGKKQKAYIWGVATGTDKGGMHPTGDQPKDVAEGEGLVVIRASSTRGRPYGEYEKQEVASTAVHELEHVRQIKAYKEKPKLMKRMSKGRYEKRRVEVKAREAEEKARRKHERIPYGSRKAGIAGHMEQLEKHERKPEEEYEKKPNEEEEYEEKEEKEEE